MVSCCVADGERAPIAFVFDIGLHIPSSSLDKGRGAGLVHLVNNLVAYEETNDIVVLVESIDDTGVSLVLIDRPHGRVRFDRNVGRGQVTDHVDACVGKLLHTVIVILGWVHGVCPNNICA